MCTKESYEKSIINTKKRWLLSVMVALILAFACAWKTNFPFWLSSLLSAGAACCLHLQHKFGLKEDFVNALWAFLGCLIATPTVVTMTASDFGVEGWWVMLPTLAVISMAIALISVAYRFGF